MTALRVVIADDELQARKRLARLLSSIPDIAVVGVCAGAEEALALVATAKPDVLVLDISMPGVSGLEARARLPDDGPAVIFVTAHAEHAVDAFDLGAVDYVLKPITALRLAKAIARVTERRVRPAIQRIAIETRGGTVLVDPATICYARFDGVLVTLASASESWVTTHTLEELADRLGPDFERVDRRHLLNVREIARLEPQPTGGCLAITRAGVGVPVSRRARRLLSRRLGL